MAHQEIANLRLSLHQQIFAGSRMCHFLRILLLISTATFLMGGCGSGNQVATASSSTNADNGINTNDNAYVVFGFNYIPKINKIDIFGRYLEGNVLQLAYSPDKKCVIYTKVVPGGTVDLFKMCSMDTSPNRLTQTDGIEFGPAINNQGDFAYAYHTYSVGESEVYLNNNKLNMPIGLYGKLVFNDSVLLGHYARLYDDTDWLFEFNTSTDIKNMHLLDMVPEQIALHGQDQLLLQGVLKRNGFAAVENFALLNKKHINLCESPCVVDDSTTTTSFIELKNIATDKALALLATRALDDNDPLGSLSATNNYLGRLSWGASYRLHGLLRMYKANINVKLPLRTIISNMAKNLVSNARFDDVHPGWLTKKYSITRNTPLSLMVDDAMIMYPLLRARNMGLVDGDTGRNIIDLAEKIFAYHEKDFDSSTSFYKFEKGIDFTFDGIWLPLNQQNTFGSAVIELYKATGNAIYKDRAFRLARAFKAEFKYLPDGRLMWHYWPSMFYAGWKESDNLSVNTPKRNPSTDTLFEDLSHASLSIAFLNDFMAAFPGEIFSASDIQGLKNTLQATRYAEKYSRFMSGDIVYQSPRLRFLPSYSWLSLTNADLVQQYSYGVPSYSPYFEGDIFAKVAFALTAER